MIAVTKIAFLGSGKKNMQA